MRKGGKGDGVSRSGDPAEDEDADPEVTAITRKLERTGDTLGAIDALEQLLLERTGQMPVVSPEMLAAYAERMETEPEPETPRTAEPEQAEPAEPVQPNENLAEAPIDWSIPAPAPIEPAPGFSEWVDPEAIAAAFDPEHGREATDVSTKVFAVFSAPDEPAAEQVAEPEAESGAEPEPTREPEHEAAPAADAGAVASEEELDGIDDLVEPQNAATNPAPAWAISAPAPAAPASPRRADPVAPSWDDSASPSQEAGEPAPPRKRRFWPFGRR